MVFCNTAPPPPNFGGPPPTYGGAYPGGQAPFGQAPYGQAPYGQAPYGQPGFPPGSGFGPPGGGFPMPPTVGFHMPPPGPGVPKPPGMEYGSGGEGAGGDYDGAFDFSDKTIRRAFIRLDIFSPFAFYNYT